MIDAAVNRAGEGLRVAEDYVRFVLDDPHLTRLAKALRHNFADVVSLVAASDRNSARDTQNDVGTAISTPNEHSRADTWAVCVASLKRAQQSLRSLEEYGKLSDAKFATEIALIRYRLYTLEKAIDTERTSRERLEGIRLCVLVDGRESTEAFSTLVKSLVDAGVGMIQLRVKNLSDRELAGRARTLKEMIRNSATVSIVNDRPDIAAATHADGVHLGQDDLSVKDARTIVGTRMLVGVSTHNMEQARSAALEGANYLGLGPTFPSQTKSFEKFPGLNTLRAVSAEIRLPIFAIGGINADNLKDVLAVGISRVAVSSAIVAAQDPHEATHKFAAALTADHSGS
jgi:thiamine-phosphate pyrophosphorylase